MDNQQLILLLVEAKSETREEMRNLLLEAVITELRFREVEAAKSAKEVKP